MLGGLSHRASDAGYGQRTGDDPNGAPKPTHSFETACPPVGGPSGGSPRHRPDCRPGALGLRRQHDGAPGRWNPRSRDGGAAARGIRQPRGIPQPIRARPDQGALRLRPRCDRRGRDARDRRHRRSIPITPSSKTSSKRATSGSYDPDLSACDAAGPDGACHSTCARTWNVRRGDHGRGTAADSGRPPRQGGPAIHGVAFDARVISVGVGPRDVEDVIDEIVAEYPENPTPEQIEELQARVVDAYATIERELERDTGIAFGRLNGRVTAVNCSIGHYRQHRGLRRAIACGNTFPTSSRRWRRQDVASRANARSTCGQPAMPTVRSEPDGSPVSASFGGNPGRASSADSGAAGSFAGRRGDEPARHDRRFFQPLRDREGVLSGRAWRGHHERRARVPLRGGRIAVFHHSLKQAGTSSAAPFVTGGIGLLAQHFRDQLGNDEIVERILATADKTGVYADADVYGQGFLDLDAATRPVGEKSDAERRLALRLIVTGGTEYPVPGPSLWGLARTRTCFGTCGELRRTRCAVLPPSWRLPSAGEDLPVPRSTSA